MDIFYNPIVGANLMSTSFARTHLGDEHFAPTNKSLMIAPHSNFKGCGLLHNVIVYHGEVEMALDFHVFDIQDFDIMIGHPLEKLFVESPRSGDLDVS